METRTAVHIGSLAATKTADGLIDPKLVLAWLLNTLGAPGLLIGLLVPIREAGSLLPQLLLAKPVERAAFRKSFWVAGSAVQGVAALGIACAAVLLPAGLAAWVIVACLAVLALARSACSVSYKDVLARTIDNGKRGRVSGTASTLSAIAVFAFAVLLATGLLPREPGFVAGAIALAGGLWLAAAALFSTLREPGGRGDPADEPLTALLTPLQEDPELRGYIATRALLISTVLAPPFLVMLGSDGALAFGNLGLLLLASSIAAIVSSYVWGALSDRSSRQTLMLSGLLAAISLGAAAALGWAGSGAVPGGFVALFVFGIQIAYEGARAGRKTHLTDMDTDGQKAVYTALSNTLIGVLLLAGGALGLLADAAGAETALAVLAGMSALAIVTGRGLSEVQEPQDGAQD